MTMTPRNPSRASSQPVATMTAISANWPMLIAGPIRLSASPSTSLMNGAVCMK